MPDLSTSYMGLALSCPIVVAACPVSSYLERIKAVEEHGAGALVIRSLFEEQVRLEERDSGYVEEETGRVRKTYFPKLKRGGVQEHLFWVRNARKAVKLPLIGSLNASRPGTWVKYATALAEAGCDALELNTYAVQADPHLDAASIEQHLYDTVQAVVEAVRVPVAVKLSPHYTNLAHVVRELEKRGPRAVVLFNRFLQPDIDALHEQAAVGAMPLSEPWEIRQALRWVALLSGRSRLELALSTGVHHGDDVAKALLAGARVAQVASVLLRQGIPHLAVLREQFEQWMRAHGHTAVIDFMGTLSGAAIADLALYERAQYVQYLLKQE